MGQPQNIGDWINLATKPFADKIGQFGHWLGDVTGANGPKQVTPYQIDYGQSNEDRANQTALYQQLQQMSQGNGPSLAQAQLQQATGQNINNAMALGAAQRGQGMGYTGALRSVADQSAAARQQAAAQSAMIRNAEQMQAMQGMGALGGQMRSQDLGQAGMGAQNAQFYGGLNAGIDAQDAAAKRQLFGGILNAAGPVVQGMTGMSHGGPVPGRTAQLDHITAGRVPGYAMGGALDSPKNDTVHAMLSPGEIVLPRSVTMAPDAAERARLFVQQVKERSKSGPPKAEHYLTAQARRKAG